MIDYVTEKSALRIVHAPRVKRLAAFYGPLAAQVALVASTAHAQNLVPNPGFEYYTTCPNTASQIAHAVPWTTPTAGSPDYFNACDTTPNNVGVPANGFGTEPAHSGNGYAGIRCYTPTPHDNYREYLEVPLTSPLVAAAVYEISFYASLADPFKYAIENLDAYLSVGAVGPFFTNVHLLLNPQVTNPTGMITNKAGWRQVSGLYTASGGESHLIIGNFRSDVATNSQNVGGICCSYYFIDDVSVKRVSCVPAPLDMVAWYSGDDTTPGDLLGHHDGAYVGFPVSSVDWVVGGGALEFHAPDTYVIVQDHNDLDFGTGDFSIDMWIKTNAGVPPPTIQSILDKRTASPVQGYHMAIANGNLLFQLADGTNVRNFTSALPVPSDGNWHFVAMMLDRGSQVLTLYVDGNSQVFNTSQVTGSLANTANLLIGARQPGLGLLVFDGLMDEIEIIDRPLTTSEVDDIYWAGSAGKCKCEPLPDGSGCRAESCPGQNQSCEPTQLQFDPVTGQYKVTDCDCLNAEACRVGLLTNFPPEPPEPYCDGDVCPQGQLCVLDQTANPDGTTSYDCCQSPPPSCEPNEAGTACNAVTCPVANQRCRPRCLRQSVATGETQIIECECRDVEGCHAALGGEGVECRSACPSGEGCHRTVTPYVEPGTGTAYIDICCDCEEVCPLPDPPVQHDPCAGFQSQDCLNGGANDICLPHCAVLSSNDFCPPTPPNMTGCDCACATPGACGPITVTGVGEPYFWNNLPYYFDYLFSCVGDCLSPVGGVCEVFHKGSNSPTYHPTGQSEALASCLPAGSVKCGCVEPSPCQPNQAGTACQGSCPSGTSCQPTDVTCSETGCTITGCQCIGGDGCHSEFSPPSPVTTCEGTCLAPADSCQKRKMIDSGGSMTHRCCCRGPGGGRCGNFDFDGDIDLGDFSYFQSCFTGVSEAMLPGCEPADVEPDGDVDLDDFIQLQQAFTGPR